VTLLDALLTRFEEVVLVDFEFNGGERNPRSEGNRPNVVCLVAHELRSGRRFRLWHDQIGLKPPYRIDAKTLFVAFYASAELICHLSKGWPLPVNILDLFIEFRRMTNHSGERQPSASLLAALNYFKLDSIEAQSKEHCATSSSAAGPGLRKRRPEFVITAKPTWRRCASYLRSCRSGTWDTASSTAVTCVPTLG
jgi:hypothetical protein